MKLVPLACRTYLPGFFPGRCCYVILRMSSPLAIMKGLTSPIAPAVAVVVAAAVAAHDVLELRTSDRAASLTG